MTSSWSPWEGRPAGRPYNVTRVLRGTGWGMAPAYKRTEHPKGSYVWEAPLQDPRDIEQLTTPTPATGRNARPTTRRIEVDEAATQRRLDAVAETLGDLLPVRIHCSPPMANVIGEATWLRGIAQVMIDMHDRPVGATGRSPLQRHGAAAPGRVPGTERASHAEQSAPLR